MSNYANKKGKVGELELAKWMEKVSGVHYRRVPMSGALHQDFPFDVMKIGSQDSVFDGIGNENKNTKQLAVKDWINQSEVAADDASVRDWFIRFALHGTNKNYFILPESYFEKLILAKKRLNEIE